MWKSMLSYTRSEKQGMIDGISLFFGALLGTNLGSLNGLAMREYTALIILLAGTVMALRIFSTTERRGHAYLLMGIYTAVVVQFLFLSKIGSGIPLEDRQRLAITLAVWGSTVLLAELTPLKDARPSTAPPAPADGPAAPAAGLREPAEG